MARLGCTIPTTGSLPFDVGLDQMAAAAERAGASSLWVSDHVVLLRETASPYPYSDDGNATWAPDVPWLETLATLSWLAASTSSVTVGSAVLVLPQRHPVLVAKAAATIDALSGGRLALGVGAGWLAEEFDVLGWDYSTRGARLEEAMEVLRACWRGAPEPFDGEFFSLPEGVLCYPRPAREAGIPLLVGGMTEPAVRRAARHGDGWLALAPLEGLDLGRVGGLLDLLHSERPAGSAASHAAISLIGKLREEHLGVLEQVARAGFDEIIVGVGWRDPEQARQLLEHAVEAAS